MNIWNIVHKSAYSYICIIQITILNVKFTLKKLKEQREKNILIMFIMSYTFRKKSQVKYFTLFIIVFIFIYRS